MKILKGRCLTEPGPRGNYLFSFFCLRKMHSVSPVLPVIVSGRLCEGARVAVDLFSYLLVLEMSLYNSHIQDLCPQNLKYASDVVSLAKLTGCQ